MEEQRVARESGYEIVKRGQQVIFVYRKTLAVLVTAAIFGGIAFFSWAWTAIVGAWGMRGDVEMSTALKVGGVLLSVGAVCLFFALWALKVFLRRRRKPVLELEEAKIADLDAGLLKQKNGRVICPLEEIKLRDSMSVLDHSRGLMRLLILETPKGKLTVFKTNSGKVLDQVKQRLIAWGIGR
jgi:hypothetical protein